MSFAPNQQEECTPFKIQSGTCCTQASFNVSYQSYMIALYSQNRGKKAIKNSEEKEKDKKKGKAPGAIRIQIDLDELDLDEIPNCSLELPNPSNLQLFNIKMVIDAKDSYWKGATYTFKFKIPDNYPYIPPKVTVNEKIYHPNIDPNGRVCFNYLKKHWRPTLTIQHVIEGLIFLFSEPNPSADPLNINAADVMKKDLYTFISNVNKSLRGQSVDGVQFDKQCDQHNIDPNSACIVLIDDLIHTFSI